MLQRTVNVFNDTRVTNYLNALKMIHFVFQERKKKYTLSEFKRK